MLALETPAVYGRVWIQDLPRRLTSHLKIFRKAATFQGTLVSF